VHRPVTTWHKRHLGGLTARTAGDVRHYTVASGAAAATAIRPLAIAPAIRASRRVIFEAPIAQELLLRLAEYKAGAAVAAGKSPVRHVPSSPFLVFCLLAGWPNRSMRA